MAAITIVNQTEGNDQLRVAVYWRPVLVPTLDSYAWRVVFIPPGGGQTILNIPPEFGVYANYPTPSDDPKDPYAGTRTAVLNFTEDTANFVVAAVPTQDAQASAASITQIFTGLVLNEVRIENNFSEGVWTHITKEGSDIYAPQVVWPGAVRIVDIRGSLCLAVISEAATGENGVIDEVTAISQTPILEGQTAVITGSVWKGYSITVS